VTPTLRIMPTSSRASAAGYWYGTEIELEDDRADYEPELGWSEFQT
jgi:hypothetical protein